MTRLRNYQLAPTMGGCDHHPPAACPECDGAAAEQREMRALPRRERDALELANLRLQPWWRALHPEPEQTGAAS